MAKQLEEPQLDVRLRHPLWFHGRLLSAADLKDEADANRQAHQFLGQAVGPGVVQGLWVERSDNQSLSISAGVAIAPDGTLLSLKETTPALAVTAVTQALVAQAGEFATCGNQVMANNWTGEGPYLLVVGAYNQLSKDRAPRSDLRNLGTLDGCDARYTEEGVQFRLVPYAPSSLTTLMDEPNRLWNRLAYLMMGYHLLNGPMADAESTLRQAGLIKEGELPVAMLFWKSGQIQFVDNWSIRRRPAHRFEQVSKSTKGSGPDDRQIALGEAMQLQLQEQYLAMQPTVNWAMVSAPAYFDLLPPAGFLTVPTGVSSAVHWGQSFLGRLQPKVWSAGPEWIDPKLREATLMPPLVIPPIDNWLVPTTPGASPSDAVPSPSDAGPGAAQAMEPVLATQLALAPTPDGKAIAFFRMIYQVPEECPTGPPPPTGASLIITVEAKVKSPFVPDRIFDGGSILPKLDPRVIIRSANGAEQEVKAGTDGTFVVHDLVAGSYLIRAASTGWAESRLRVGLAAGDTKQVTVLVVPTLGRRFVVRTLRPSGGHFLMPTVLPEAIDLFQGSKLDPLTWQESQGLAPSVRPWLISWSDELASKDLDLPVYPPDLRVMVNPEWNDESTSADPYAVAVLGPGVYLPILLTGSYLVLDKPMGVGELQLHVNATRVFQYLVKRDLDDLDVAAGFPYKTLGTLTDLAPEDARVLVLLLRSELQQVANGAQTQGSILAPIEKALVDHGYTHYETAYSTPEEVVQALSAKGVNVTRDVANALIINAQYKINPHK